MLRVIREVAPTWVVGENVGGLINWSGGLVFEEVQTDLEAEGYEVQPYVLPSAGVNAPHRRDRVWFVAYRSSECVKPRAQRGRGEHKCEGEQVWCVYSAVSESGATPDTRLQRPQRPEQQAAGVEQCNKERDVSSSNSIGLQRLLYEDGQKCSIPRVNAATSNSLLDRPGDWENFPTQSPICDRNDGLSSRLSGITFPKWRNESIKAMGNAIVPQVAFQIFKAINQYSQP